MWQAKHPDSKSESGFPSTTTSSYLSVTGLEALGAVVSTFSRSLYTSQTLAINAQAY